MNTWKRKVREFGCRGLLLLSMSCALPVGTVFGEDGQLLYAVYDTEVGEDISFSGGNAEDFETYTVSFDLNGGHWSAEFEYEYKNGYDTVSGKDYISLPEAYCVVLDGYRCTGWTEQKNGSPVLTGDYNITKNVRLYAKWKKLTSVSFDLNGGYWIQNDGEVYDYQQGFFGEPGNKLVLPGSEYVERPGYRLLGWSESSGGTGDLKANEGYTVEKETVLHAIWERRPVLTFDLKGGTWRETEETRDFIYKDGFMAEKQGDGCMLPGSFYVEKEGHYLLGWSKTDGGPIIEDMYYDNLRNDETVYAKWEKQDSGGGQSSKHEHDYGKGVIIEKPTVFETGLREYTCSICKKTKTEEIDMLQPYLKVGSTKITIGKNNTGSIVVKIAAGDSVKVKTSAPDIATASYKDGKLKIKALKKAGTATLTLTTRTGKTSKIKVTVPKVSTTKLTCKNVTVKKGGKVTLKPVVTPKLSDDKISFTSKNRKIATVTSKGVVKGIGKGSTVIVVKSGKKAVNVKVTVK